MLYGGMRLNGFVPVSDPVVLGRLPAEARGKVFQCDLREAGVTDYSRLVERGFLVTRPGPTLEVFFDGAPLMLARCRFSRSWRPSRIRFGSASRTRS